MGLIRKRRRLRRLANADYKASMQSAAYQMLGKDMLQVARALYEFAKRENWAREPGVVHPYWVGPKDYGWELAEEVLKLKFGENAMEKFKASEVEEEKRREELRKAKDVPDGTKEDVPRARPGDGSEGDRATTPVRAGDKGGDS